MLIRHMSRLYFAHHTFYTRHLELLHVIAKCNKTMVIIEHREIY